MDATPQEPILTLDDDLDGEIASLRRRARDELDGRRSRLVELQRQIADQTRSIASQLERDRASLDGDRNTLEAERKHLEEQLARLETLRSELADDRTQWDSQQSGMIQRQETLLKDLTEQYDRLETVRQELDQREQEFHEQQVRFEHEQSTLFSLQIQQAEREEQLDRSDKEIKASQEELSRREAELASKQAELESRREELDSLKRELESKQSELASLEETTLSQRKQIAARLRQQKAEGVAEIERRKAEAAEINSADEGQLRRELELVQQQCQALRDEISDRETRADELQRQLARLEEQHSAEQARRNQAEAEREKLRGEYKELQKQLEETHRKHDVLEAKLDERLTQLNELKAEIEQLRQASKAENEELSKVRGELENARGQTEVLKQQHDDSRAALKQKDEEIARLQSELQQAGRSESDSDATRLELQRVIAERDGLLARLEQQADAPLPAASSDEAEEYRQRYDAALSDIRELKQTNRELEEKLKKAREQGSASAESFSAGGEDGWEAQKRKLLAALDDEGDDVSQERQKERLKIEETIRITDQVIAEKEREIAELKELLEQQSGSIGDMAVGAGAIAQMVDADELIQEERENLKRMQDQWREKLREAELEVSVEKAKIARERTELDERIQQFENERVKLERVLSEAADDPSKRPNKRKWLERLGLKGDE